MEENGLEPNAEAAPETWLRRASLDLTGLPPTPGELDQFLRQQGRLGEEALELAVDRMLASPAFGERWAGDWLDLARYADSKGLGRDGRRTIWKYRNWVIDAFNADLPFDEFTVKQLAGDLLPDATMEDLIATAFHRNTQSNDEGGTDDEQFRVEAVIDRVNTTWQIWQGITFGCAQCHKHPYDPFRMEDYYRAMAFLNNTADSDSGSDEPLLEAPLNEADYARARELDRRISTLREKLWRPADKVRREVGVWRNLAPLKAGTKYGSPIVVERGESMDEFVLPKEVKQKTLIVLEAPVPVGLSRITALRITAKPRDVKRALADSEWGFILTRMKAEILPPGNGGETVTIPLTRAYADEPEPLYDPAESLKNGNFGFAAYTRINHPREAVFLPEKPFPVAPGSTLRVSMDHSVFLLASFTMAIRRGSVAVSDDERWTALTRDREREKWRAELEAALRERAEISSVSVPVMRERPDWLRRPTHVFARGDYLAKEERVAPAVPEFPGGTGGVCNGGRQGDGRRATRLDLARWLVSPVNPLTARVTVNRYWERMFGRGIVVTLDDFGAAGGRPSHPELLDFLAARFQEELGWSMKGLLRELALSATYRQSAATAAEKRAVDPGNTWLARGTRRRLAAEMVRDQSLATAGLLSRKLHGPPVRPPIPEGVWLPYSDDPWETNTGGDRFRRSIYTAVKRSIPYPTFVTFDGTTRDMCVARRPVSNTPLQALTLLNDTVFAECASGLARRVEDAGTTVEERIAFGYRLLTSRAIDEGRLADLLELHRKALRRFKDAKPGGMPEKSPELSALNQIAEVLLNMDEALTR